MAETKTSKRDDIPKPEWECIICGSRLVDYIFDKRRWKITKTYHFTGFWMQNGQMVWTGKICPNASKLYCRECGATQPKHYAECSRSSKGTQILHAFMRAHYLLEKEIEDEYKHRYFMVDRQSNVLLQSTETEMKKHAPSSMAIDTQDYLIKIILHRQKERPENWQRARAYKHKGIYLLAEEKKIKIGESNEQTNNNI